MTTHHLLRRDTADPHDAVVTLGPEGTDAHHEARRHFAKVLLTDTFELAVREALSRDCHALVAAGFVERHRPGGEVSDLWVDIHFRHLGQVELAAVWEAPTKPMCLAAPPGIHTPRTVALHPATGAFAERYAPAAGRRYVDAKPLAVRQVLDGTAEGCIGSVDVVQHAGLAVLQEFQPTMVWCLYRAVNRHIPGR
ncbi:hypothetical protein [Streptomyces sp. CBMA123]|uniref:hypothetical protein n=1 Tax=Streptomyces sp. CBMA123 TaxID=1896313 RepID=UPI001CB7B4C7|nr:hypothetical protein [Streptomyces sp. CBMA123]